MTKNFAVTINGINRPCEIPNECPLCHHRVIISNVQTLNQEGTNVQAIFLCPNSDCNNFFICYYEQQKDNSMRMIKIIPTKVEIDVFPNIIHTISSSFVSIYQEATEANALGLKQIAGPGYRKSFEFLIKDYAKHKSETDKYSEIEKSFSGEVINKFIGDSRIQKVAKRALWLGNDETHYLRKWEDHDIEDLLKLIKLTINWIEIEQLSEDYIKELPEPNKS